MVVGAWLWVRPFIGPAPVWHWRIQSNDDLNAASVNARQTTIGSEGVRLDAQGARPISLISPPLSGLGAGRPIVQVRASLAKSDSSGVVVRANLLWQTAPGPAFQYQETMEYVEGDTVVLVFAPPVDAASIHRLGVQFPGLPTVTVRELAMIDAGLVHRVDLALRGATAPEKFGPEAVNFHRGPTFLGRAANYYAVATVLVLAGGAVLWGRFRRRPVGGAALVGACLVVWAVADARFTFALADRAWNEAGDPLSGDESSQIEAIYGRDTAEAAGLVSILPRGARFAVVSADPVTIGHRLAYLCAPRQALVGDPLTGSLGDAGYVVVLPDARERFDAAAGQLRLSSGETVAMRRVNAADERILLLERTRN